MESCEVPAPRLMRVLGYDHCPLWIHTILHTILGLLTGVGSVLLVDHFK